MYGRGHTTGRRRERPQQTPDVLQRMQCIAESILAAGYSFDASTARGIWQRYGIEDCPDYQRLVLAAIDDLGRRKG